MKKKNIRERLPEPKTIEKPLPIDTSSSPAFAKPNVVRSPNLTQSSNTQMSLEEMQDNMKKHGYGRTKHNDKGEIIGVEYVPPQ